MFGVFFEDINFSADGGLYAELIKNRSFEFHHPFIGWTPFGDIKVLNETPCFDKNPHYVRLHEKGYRSGTGLENCGFRGIGLKRNNDYKFSFYARSPNNNPMTFLIELVNSNDEIIGQEKILIKGSNWVKYTCTIRPTSTEAKGKIRLKLETPGVADLDHISLFPAETWKNRENGLRKDLAEALYDINPGVLRFPGGCIIEGNTLQTRYQWKNSIGPVENRPLNENRWNYTFKHRFFPDYYQTYGLGFYEFFLLCEDLGTEALPVINCGMACQYESKECVPLEKLDLYIQDAIDLIEFANGPEDSQWGKIRAQMGHPESFNLKMIAIGNEQWGEGYVQRMVEFLKILRKKHPEIKIIGTAGPSPEGEKFDYLWSKMKELQVDMVDEHYYRSPEWFLENAKRYNNYDRKGPKVFAGEYAAHDKNRENNLRSALAEAAFMTGLERNADIVHMATYAPLFAHIEAWQWKPDMIWFDNLSVVKTPNYYIQQLYASNQGTNVLPITLNKEIITGQDSLYASAVLDLQTSEVIIKIVNTSYTAQDLKIELKGLKKTIENHEVKIITLHSNQPYIVNTLNTPTAIIPEHYSIRSNNNYFQIKTLGNAFYVCKIKII